MPFATHILVPTDFSQASELAVEAAAALARSSGAKVTLLHVHDPAALRPPATIGWNDGRQQSVEHEIEQTIAQSFDALLKARLQGVNVSDMVVLHDSAAAPAICAYAEQVGADLIVIATHGRTGLKQLLIGSVAERVVRHSTVPVLTLRSRAVD